MISATLSPWHDAHIVYQGEIDGGGECGYSPSLTIFEEIQGVRARGRVEVLRLHSHTAAQAEQIANALLRYVSAAHEHEAACEARREARQAEAQESELVAMGGG